MKETKWACTIAVVLALYALAATPVSASSQHDEGSAAIVAKLTAFLTSNHLDSLAVEDPSQPGQMVAVLHVPKVQLLVIAGRCASVDALRARLTAKAYRDVYSDLHGCATPDSRLFIQDLGANGLAPERPRAGGAFDIVYEHMTQQTRFDGDHTAQKMSKEEYQRRFRAVDVEYARLASLLLTQSTTAK